jgi:hypothetical protein
MAENAGIRRIVVVFQDRWILESVGRKRNAPALWVEGFLVTSFILYIERDATSYTP